ncbi:MAG: amidase family protein [Pseudomonadota bacterium]
MVETRFTGPDLCRLTAREAVAKLKAGEIAPADLIDAAEARIAATGPAINATPTLCFDRARTAASALPADPGHPGWLAGLPLTIKDLTPVAGVRTTFGTPAFADHVPAASAPLVERLEARGGVVIGKSNTPEMGAGANTFNAVLGTTRNPWSTAMNAGGSSGGAAAALAAGEVWLAHGSDLAGSLRTPAAYCGVVGLRPVPGRAGGGPATAAFLTEGVSGPMARNVGDIALFLDAMAGFDPREPITLPEPAESFQAALARDPGPIRIAFAPDQGGFAPVEADVADCLAAAMRRAADADRIAVEEACPDLPGLEEANLTLRGLHFGAVNAAHPPEVQAQFKATLAQNTAEGLALSSETIYRALRQRTVLYQTMRAFLERYDVLALPVVGLAPRPVEEEYPAAVSGVAVRSYVDWLRFAFLATTTGLPAIALPCGFVQGLPMAIQLIGPPRGEARLLQVAARLEALFGFPATPIDPVVTHG